MNKVLKIILIVLAAGVLTALISVAVCSTAIKTTEYTVQIEGIDNEFKVVMFSDLHSLHFGKDNSRLLEKIAAQEPDVIFTNGDLINYDASEEQIQDMLNLLAALQEIAPVYTALGNHEIVYTQRNGESLLDRIEATGVTLLNDSYVETEICGNALRIGGSCVEYWTSGSQDREQVLEVIGQTDVPSIALLHCPEALTNGHFEVDESWTADVFLSGHTHGGVIRIPFVGGLVAPFQGYFPEYDYGRYTVHDRHDLIITSGLAGYRYTMKSGNKFYIPRLFNIPEIVVLEFSGK